MLTQSQAIGGFSGPEYVCWGLGPSVSKDIGSLVGFRTMITSCYLTLLRHVVLSVLPRFLLHLESLELLKEAMQPMC